MFLIPTLNPEADRTYSAFIAALVMIGQTTTAFNWKRIADTIGCKFAFPLGFLYPYCVPYGLLK